MWGVSLTHPMLASFYVGSFSHTSHAGFFMWEFLLHIPCWLLYVEFFLTCWLVMLGVYLTHPVLAVWCREFLLHILCLVLYVWSFSYTSSAGFFVWGVSLTRPVLASLCGVFLLHVLCWLLCVGSFSYTSHPMLASLCGNYSYMYCASFFMWRVSLTHPMLAALCGVFLFHFHASFFMLVVSLTHPMLAVWCGEFLFHVPYWLYNVGSFSYTSRAGFLMWGIFLTCSLEAGGCFILGFSLTHPMDMLTIPTAYQKTKQIKKLFRFLWEYLLWK